MAVDFNMIFFFLFIILFVTLGITNIVAAQKAKDKAKPGQMYFALLYLVAATIMVVYKMNNPLNN